MEQIEASEPVYNIFADLGFPDPETHLLKAGIVARIDRVVRRRRLTDAQAAKLFGLSRKEVTKMLDGDFVGYPVEKLLQFLTVLGRDVEIVIRPSKSRRPGKLTLAEARQAA